MTQSRVKFGLVGAVVVSTIALSGCSAAEPGSAPSTTATSSAFTPVTATDGSGATVTVDKPAARIVCLTGVCDDVLVSLGITPVASSDAGKDGLLADSRFLGPEKAAEVPLIGGSFGDENTEDVIKAEPDLVIGLDGAQNQVAKAIGSDVPTYLARIATYKDMEAFTTWVGRVTQHEAQAATTIKKFETVLDTARARKTAGMSSLSIFGTDTNFSADSEGSLLGSVLSQLGDYPWPDGAENDNSHEPGVGNYSLEEILRKNPDVIFVQTFSFGAPGPKVSEQLADNAVWSRLDAVKDKRVIEVPTTIWATGRGPISLTAVVEQAVDAMYGS